jgi:hypothetical protein
MIPPRVEILRSEWFGSNQGITNKLFQMAVRYPNTAHNISKRNPEFYSPILWRVRALFQLGNRRSEPRTRTHHAPVFGSGTNKIRMPAVPADPPLFDWVPASLEDQDRRVQPVIAASSVAIRGFHPEPASLIIFTIPNHFRAVANSKSTLIVHERRHLSDRRIHVKPYFVEGSGQDRS